MSQLITALPVGTCIKMTETVDGNSIARPYLIISSATDNPYGNNGVLLVRLNSVSETATFGQTSYDGSGLDTKMIAFSNRFDLATKSQIATSTVIVDDVVTGETHTIARQFFALEGIELGQTGTAESRTPIPYFSSSEKRICKDEGGTAREYITGSLRTTTSIYFVNASGSFLGGNNGINQSARYRPACNIYATALVSDEPDEDGYYALIPDPTDPYVYVRFDASLGAVANKPLNIRVDLTTEGNPEIYELQVCNNYKDTAPTWETMTEGKKHAFTNEAKSTENWEIGVRVVARGENSIRVYEPFAIIQTEVD